MITVYTIAYNEEIILPFFIKWYRERFPNCKIVIYDNYSTDNTEKIALENNCEVIKYDTNNQLSDSKYLEIKNNCWKNAETDWVLICDADEFLDIKQEDLLKESGTIVLSKGYNMYNIVGDETVENTYYGVRAKQYDKFYLFNRQFVKEINYSPGCHNALPKGRIVFSDKKYLLFHYSHIGKQYMINRYKRNAERLSQENIKKGWGFHYKDSEKQIEDKFNVAREYYEKNKNNLNQEEVIIWKNF